jgi:hypothetical protein
MPNRGRVWVRILNLSGNDQSVVLTDVDSLQFVVLAVLSLPAM